MTAPLLSGARQVIILVAGAAKRQALERLLDPREDPARTPAKLVTPRGEVLVPSNRLSPQRILRRAPTSHPRAGNASGLYQRNVVCFTDVELKHPTSVVLAFGHSSHGVD